MGLYKCQVHGLTDGAQVCQHVLTWMRANARERTFVIRDRFRVPILVCPDCFSEHGDPTEDLGQNGPHVTCFDHLEAWYRSTDQGVLTDALRAAGWPPTRK